MFTGGTHTGSYLTWSIRVYYARVYVDIRVRFLLQNIWHLRLHAYARSDLRAGSSHTID
jgi:hypothetical protein